MIERIEILWYNIFVFFICIKEWDVLDEKNHRYGFILFIGLVFV